MAGIKILVIDDEPSVHEILEKYLTLSHYQVVHAFDGKQGIGMMESENPDLALLDVQMPVMDGFATLAAIQKKPRLGHIPILFLTSLDRQHLKVKGLELGADDYIIKPFNMSELLARIKASLRKTARYRNAEGTMAGNLADVALADLLQSMEMGAKTATVVMNDMDAAVYLDQGRLAYAKQGPFEKEQALERIFFMEKGSFSMRFGDLPAEIPKNPQPMMSVLMGVLSTVDEVRAVLEKIGKGKSLLLEGDFSSVGVPRQLRRTGPMALEDLVCSMDQSLKTNLKTIAAALKDGRLKKAVQAP